MPLKAVLWKQQKKNHSCCPRAIIHTGRGRGLTIPNIHIPGLFAQRGPPAITQTPIALLWRLLDGGLWSFPPQPGSHRLSCHSQLSRISASACWEARGGQNTGHPSLTHRWCSESLGQSGRGSCSIKSILQMGGSGEGDGVEEMERRSYFPWLSRPMSI